MTSRLATYLGYAAIGLSLVAWGVFTAATGRFTAGRLWTWVSSRRAGLVAGLLLWAWVGWHLFVRGAVTFLH